jgi:hypothetical protein
MGLMAMIFAVAAGAALGYVRSRHYHWSRL